MHRGAQHTIKPNHYMSKDSTTQIRQAEKFDQYQVNERQHWPEPTPVRKRLPLRFVNEDGHIAPSEAIENTFILYKT